MPCCAVECKVRREGRERTVMGRALKSDDVTWRGIISACPALKPSAVQSAVLGGPSTPRYLTAIVFPEFGRCRVGYGTERESSFKGWRDGGTSMYAVSVRSTGFIISSQTYILEENGWTTLSLQVLCDVFECSQCRLIGPRQCCYKHRPRRLREL